MPFGSRIYCLRSKTEGKIYIGQTTFFDGTRWKQHQKAAAHGSQTDLHQAIRRLGPSDFTEEHLAYANSQKMLDKAEIRWIHKLLADLPAHGYNLAKGGRHLRRKQTPRIRRKRTTVQQHFAERKAEWIRRTFGLTGILKSQKARTPEEFLSLMHTDSKSAKSRLTKPSLSMVLSWRSEQKA